MSGCACSHREVTSVLPVGRNTALCHYWMCSIYDRQPLCVYSLVGGEVHTQHFRWNTELPQALADWYMPMSSYTKTVLFSRFPLTPETLELRLRISRVLTHSSLENIISASLCLY